MGVFSYCSSTQAVRAVWGTYYDKFLIFVIKADAPVKANCWFMVSFIYECLDEIFHGSAVSRFLYSLKGSEEVRDRIKITSRLIVTFPFEEVVRTTSPFFMFGYPGMLTSFESPLT